MTAALADDGTYLDPTTESPLAGPALAEHVSALVAAFPDLSFEVLSVQPAELGADGTMVVRWLMRGTNTGPWHGQPPTGRPVAVRGVEVLTVTAGKITSAEGYFDRQGLAEQLGFQMRPLPPAAGPVQFGYAARASAGIGTVPGAFSLTWLDARTQEEAEEIKLTSAVVAAELIQEPGFLSWVGMEDTEDFGAAVGTGVWSPHHVNAIRVRCPSCARLTDRAQASGLCACGQPLSQMPEYW